MNLVTKFYRFHHIYEIKKIWTKILKNNKIKKITFDALGEKIS